MTRLHKYRIKHYRNMALAQSIVEEFAAYRRLYQLPSISDYYGSLRRVLNRCGCLPHLWPQNVREMLGAGE